MRPVVLLSLLAACTPPVEPNGAGVYESTAEGPGGVELPVAVWYPANVDDASERATYGFDLQGDAYVDATPASGPFPIILMSHGNGGARHAGAPIYERWAAEGYVVVAMDHVGNTFTDSPTGAQWVEIYIRRPSDVAAAYQAAVAWSEDEDSPLSGLVDAETVVVAGHSTGGATAILASGGGMNRATVLAACSIGQLSGTACELAGEGGGPEILLTPAGLPEPVATLAFAPLDGGLFASSLDLSGASLVMVGTEDDVTPSSSHATPLYQAMPSPKVKVELRDANHYGFATVCGIPGLELVLREVAEQCEDPAYMSEATFIDATATISLAFLDEHVRGNGDADVEAAAAAFPTDFDSE